MQFDGLGRDENDTAIFSSSDTTVHLERSCTNINPSSRSHEIDTTTPDGQQLSLQEDPNRLVSRETLGEGFSEHNTRRGSFGSHAALFTSEPVSSKGLDFHKGYFPSEPTNPESAFDIHGGLFPSEPANADSAFDIHGGPFHIASPQMSSLFAQQQIVLPLGT